MNATNPLSSNGKFTQTSLPELLKGFAAQRSSGRLRLTVGALGADSSVGNLYFIQGRLAAAEFGELGAVAAFQRLTATREGTYEFSEMFVQLSQLGIDKRIHQTLETLLAFAPPGSAPSSTPQLERLPDQSRPAAQPSRPAQTRDDPPINQSGALDAFDLDALNDAVMRSGYLEALTAIFVRSVGPAGYVLLEDIAQDTGVDLRVLTATQASKLSAALLLQIPAAKRAPFQIASATYFEQFKP